MTAHEEDDERVVLLHPQLRVTRRHERLVDRPFTGHDVLAPAPRELAAQVVVQTSDGYLIQPAARVVGEARYGPLRRGRDQRLLDGVLGGGEVPMTTRHGAEDLRRQLAQQVLDGGAWGLRRHTSVAGARMTWRTSTGMMSGVPPGPGAVETFAAIS